MIALRLPGMTGDAGRQRERARALAQADHWLLGAAVALLVLGVVMVGSASVSIAERQTGQPLYYFIRQLMFAGLGLLFAAWVWQRPMQLWQQAGPYLLMLAMVLLVMVLIPGIGKSVNGASRWLPLGVLNLQVSELAKLFAFIYLAGYLVRHGSAVRTRVRGFAKPTLLLCVMSLLLLMEPDFGATVVLMSTAMGMMFLAGVRLWQFGVLIGLAGGTATLLAVSSPYRMQRLTTFLDPWADPFNTGFQLTQALIAFGRGEWMGVGLGGGFQKMFYLPEAHTDFLFAVIAEELGLIGVAIVLCLYAILVWRTLMIGAAAERAKQCFSAYLAYGIGIWIGLQAFVNMGVNMGVLPTKGLTLPLMSYGGSSLVVMCGTIALLMRIDREVRQAGNSDARERGAR